jgi:ATP-binding cassette subfamily B protein
VSWLRDNQASISDLRQHAAGLLEPGEQAVVWLATDLDASLRFRTAVAVLTNRRILRVERTRSQVISHRTWDLTKVDEICVAQWASTASVDLLGSKGLLSRWHVTAQRQADAQAFALRFKMLRSGTKPLTEQPALPKAANGGPPHVPVEDEPAAPPSRSILRLVRFARPWYRQIILGFALTLASTGAALVAPYLTMPLLDKVLIPLQNGESVQLSLLYLYLGGLAGAAVAAWLLGWARTYTLAWVSERISGELRNQTYGHLQRLSLTYFSRKRTGDLISRVSSDTDRLCYFLSVNMIDFVCDMLTIVLTAGILISINPVLALLTLVPLPLIAWLVQRVRERLRGGFAASTRAWGEMTSVLADTIPGIRVVKAFAQEEREIERFGAANRHVLDANDRVNRTWSFFGPMIVLLTDAGLLVVWACGAWGVYRGHITVGVLTAFVAYISRFYNRLDSMSRMLAAVQRAAASAARIFEVLDLEPDVPIARRPVHVQRLQGALEFRDVSFRYGPREVIRGVNLKIEPGEMVGLVGHSGAGKTTLVNLTCRFYDVTEGTILVDGVDLRDLDVDQYRRNIGLVLQEPFLFYGTIAENIAYGKPHASRAEIVAAARAARAHDFILKLPDGYDSTVGERGQQLSGGERQRISIARALLIDPAILILDEATSSVDTETEREIQLALENLIRGRTTIAIAHRLSTLRRADRLVVIEDGRIIEVGPHAELIKSSGTYARLHEALVEMSST